MENSIKALLIAASVIIGMMIISIGVSLYASLSSYVENTQEEITKNEIRQFNEQFTKYINYDTLTIQDIVTATNIAYENNLKTDYYVTVNMPGNTNLQNKIKTDSVEILKNGLGKQYKCNKSDIKLNPITRRVSEISFSEYTGP